MDIPSPPKSHKHALRYLSPSPRSLSRCLVPCTTALRPGAKLGCMLTTRRLFVTIPPRAPRTSRIGCVKLLQALSETGISSKVRKSECVGMKYGARMLISPRRRKQEKSTSASYALRTGAIPSRSFCHTSRDIITAQGCTAPTRPLAHQRINKRSAQKPRTTE